MKKFIIEIVFTILIGLFIVIYFDLPSYLIPILTLQLTILSSIHEIKSIQTIIQIKEGVRNER